MLRKIIIFDHIIWFICDIKWQKLFWLQYLEIRYILNNLTPKSLAYQTSIKQQNVKTHETLNLLKSYKDGTLRLLLQNALSCFFPKWFFSTLMLSNVIFYPHVAAADSDSHLSIQISNCDRNRNILTPRFCYTFNSFKFIPWQDLKRE